MKMQLHSIDFVSYRNDVEFENYLPLLELWSLPLLLAPGYPMLEYVSYCGYMCKVYLAGCKKPSDTFSSMVAVTVLLIVELTKSPAKLLFLGAELLRDVNPLR